MSDARVSELLSEVGVPADFGARCSILGADPVLPVGFPIGECAAVALGAGASIASGLWSARTGRSQDVSVDVTAAAASLIGFILQRVEDGPGLEPPGAMTDRIKAGMVALHRCADGRWIHLHGATPKLADGTLSVLGCDPVRDEVAAAVAGWQSGELEDALAAAGTCGAIVRTADEWAAHPQGVAVGGLARVEVDRIGDSPPEPVGDGVRPLGGVRVLDLTRMLAGPSHGRVLAEHGADVLLVNSPSVPNPMAFVADTSHGKLSTFLDLETAEGVGGLRSLVASADVFCQGYRSGTLERRGFGLSDLVTARPGIIYVTINCYGDIGPWRERPGWEQLAQSVTGLASWHGGFDSPDVMPAAACDYTTGYLAAVGTLAALWRRSVEGGSYHVRASLCQTGMWLAGDGPSCDPALASGLGGVSAWMTSTSTGFGTLHHLRPVVSMSETPPSYARPSRPLGVDPPEWP